MRSFQNIWTPTPLDEQSWRKQLSAGQKITIEIGAGAGLHAIQFAQSNPDQLLIAIERTKIKAAAMQQRIQHHPHINNIYAVYGDAIEWICRHCQPEEISAFYILYPNPYPKEKQANKRFFNMPFMAHLIDMLKPGGTITLATNIESYYHEAKQLGQTVWGLSLISDHLIDKNQKPRTHFEKKYLARNERCYNTIFQKPNDAPTQAQIE